MNEKNLEKIKAEFSFGAFNAREKIDRILGKRQEVISEETEAIEAE